MRNNASFFQDFLHVCQRELESQSQRERERERERERYDCYSKSSNTLNVTTYSSTLSFTTLLTTYIAQRYTLQFDPYLFNTTQHTSISYISCCTYMSIQYQKRLMQKISIIEQFLDPYNAVYYMSQVSIIWYSMSQVSIIWYSMSQVSIMRYTICHRSVYSCILCHGSV